jgi:TonB family protein
MKPLLISFLVAAYAGCSVFAQANSSKALAVEAAVAPTFPPIAVAANVSGDVIVEVKVGEKGEVLETRSSNAHPLLREASESAAFRWRFVPDASGEKARVVQLTFSYRILPLKTPATELATIFMPPYSVEVRHKQFEPIVHSDPPSYTIPPKRERRKKRRE